MLVVEQSYGKEFIISCAVATRWVSTLKIVKTDC